MIQLCKRKWWISAVKSSVERKWFKSKGQLKVIAPGLKGLQPKGPTLVQIHVVPQEPSAILDFYSSGRLVQPAISKLVQISVSVYLMQFRQIPEMATSL